MQQKFFPYHHIFLIYYSYSASISVIHCTDNELSVLSNIISIVIITYLVVEI